MAPWVLSATADYPLGALRYSQGRGRPERCSSIAVPRHPPDVITDRLQSHTPGRPHLVAGLNLEPEEKWSTIPGVIKIRGPCLTRGCTDGRAS